MNNNIRIPVFLIFLVQHISVKATQFDVELGYFGPSNVTAPSISNLTSTRSVGLALDFVTQKLDNFNNATNKTWQQRYVSDDTAFDGSGPMYIIVGGQQDIGNLIQLMFSGMAFNMAQTNNGYLFLLEQRYYGQSIPVATMGTINMRYLTAEQTMADIANFVADRKKAIPKLQNSKVVLIGAGYGGDLTGWMRSKYPEIVDAAVASSAPIDLQVEDKTYFESALNSLPDQCTATILNAIGSIYYLLQSPDGQAKVAKDFWFCNGTDFNDVNNVKTFYYELISILSTQLEYGTSQSIYRLCMTVSYPVSQDDYTRFAKYMSQIYYCFHTYKDMVSYYRNTQINQYSNLRSALYQKCSQFGQFATTWYGGEEYDLVTIDFYYQLCYDTFGALLIPPRVNYLVNKANGYFGGLNPGFTQVVSTKGSIDPSRALMLVSNTTLAPLVGIKGTSHGADIEVPSPTDSDVLKAARKQIRQLIANWVQ